MHQVREHRLRQSRVTAVFEDRALSFILARGATMEELSDRLADLGRRRNGSPVAITVKFGSSSRNAKHSAGPSTGLRTPVPGRGVDGLRQHTDAEKSERADVEHNTG